MSAQLPVESYVTPSPYPCTCADFCNAEVVDLNCFGKVFLLSSDDVVHMSTYPVGGGSNALRSTLNDVFYLDTAFSKACVRVDKRLRKIAQHTIAYFKDKREAVKEFNDGNVDMATIQEFEELTHVKKSRNTATRVDCLAHAVDLHLASETAAAIGTAYVAIDCLRESSPKVDITNASSDVIANCIRAINQVDKLKSAKGNPRLVQGCVNEISKVPTGCTF